MVSASVNAASSRVSSSIISKVGPAHLRSRLANRVQLTTYGHKAYLAAVEEAFGDDVDYAQLVKLYGEAPEAEKRYSPAVCIGARKERITGNPDRDAVSTSHVERSNLSMRMHMRRFTRLTNAHSKKFENHCHMVALYTVRYNYARINSAVKMAPAIAAGISARQWIITDLVKLIDDAEGPAKKRKLRQCQIALSRRQSVTPEHPPEPSEMRAPAQRHIVRYAFKKGSQFHQRPSADRVGGLLLGQCSLL